MQKLDARRLSFVANMQLASIAKIGWPGIFDTFLRNRVDQSF
jgi:hypothetical protein